MFLFKQQETWGKFATSLPLSGYVRSIAICASLLGSLVSSDQKKNFSEDCHRVNLFYYVSSFVFRNLIQFEFFLMFSFVLYSHAINLYNALKL